jgi:hypothetical protein
MTDRLPQLGIYYIMQPSLVGNRLENVTPSPIRPSSHTWNIESWDVK